MRQKKGGFVTLSSSVGRLKGSLVIWGGPSGTGSCSEGCPAHKTAYTEVHRGHGI